MSRVWVVVAVSCALVSVADAKRKPPNPVDPAAAGSAHRATPGPAAEAAPVENAAENAAVEEAAGGGLPPHKLGPARIDLGDGIEIDLPEGMILLERTEARASIAARGDNPEGVIATLGKIDSDWEIVISFDPVGYVSDADADQLGADELFAALDRGNRAQNKRRVAQGVSELFLDGWSHPPSYDRAARLLRWGLRLHDDDAPLLNEFTNVLGRKGYAMLNLIVAPDRLEPARVEAAPALRGVHFQVGHRHEDFDPAVDRSSGLGLRGLILGGSAIAVGSKLGFFAKLLLIMKKGFLLIAAAIAGLWKWLTGRGKDAASPAESPPDATPPAV